MATVAAAPLDPKWHYEFVSSADLPVVDLSLSVKSHLFSGNSLRVVNAIMRRLLRPFMVMNASSQILFAVLGFLPACTARIVAVFVFMLNMPLNFINASVLRLDIVRLVAREDGMIFLCFINAVTNMCIGVVFGDVRAVPTLSNVVGWINMLFIDAQMTSTHFYAPLLVLAIAVVSIVLVCFFLNEIDEPHGLTLWQYYVYSVPATDYVVNGLSTFLVLMLKIVYRKRTSMRHTDQSQSIRCVVLQCRIKLIPFASQRITSEGSSNSTTAISHLQRLQLVPSDRIYDGRKIVFPAFISSELRLPCRYTRLLYGLGNAGLVLWIAASGFINRSNDVSSSVLNDPTESHSLLETAITMAAVGCSASFFLVFLGCYQWELLELLVSSFDFVFNSVQASAIHLAAAVLYDWERDYCIWLLTCWLWMHWVFCLDALTPLMKTKLRFRLRYALPVALVLLIGMALLVLRILVIGMNPPKGRTIWTNIVLGRTVSIKVLPFFVTRLSATCDSPVESI